VQKFIVEHPYEHPESIQGAPFKNIVSTFDQAGKCTVQTPGEVRTDLNERRSVIWFMSPLAVDFTTFIRPLTLRLPSVDEGGVVDVVSSPVEVSSPKTNRRRVESTTSISSRYPTSPKTPQEGRASLDIAAGEFIPVRRTSANEFLPAAVSSPATPTETAEDAKSATKKGKWCRVM
jgi:hypothetical protein